MEQRRKPCRKDIETWLARSSKWTWLGVVQVFQLLRRLERLFDACGRLGEVSLKLPDVWAVETGAFVRRIVRTSLRCRKPTRFVGGSIITKPLPLPSSQSCLGSDPPYVRWPWRPPTTVPVPMDTKFVIPGSEPIVLMTTLCGVHHH